MQTLPVIDSDEDDPRLPLHDSFNELRRVDISVAFAVERNARI